MKILTLTAALVLFTTSAQAADVSVNCPLYSQTVFTSTVAKQAGSKEADVRIRALMSMPISWSSEATRSDAVDVVLAVEAAFSSKETNPTIAAQEALARCTQNRQPK